jgi:broad specificity polyphosphatase/5'/3'-nucleotidase SurE
MLYLFGEPDEIIPEADASPGTDIGALRAGLVSVTPLSSGADAAFFSRLTEAFPIGSPRNGG